MTSEAVQQLDHLAPISTSLHDAYHDDLPPPASNLSSESPLMASTTPLDIPEQIAFKANEPALATQLHVADPNETAAFEAYSTFLQDETMVADKDEESKGDKERVSTSTNPESLRAPSPRAGDSHEAAHESVPDSIPTHAHTVNEAEGGTAGDWDPLRKEENEEMEDLHEKTVIEDGGDVVDSHGRVLFPGDEAKSTPAVSRRTSHLHLNLKPPSPQPWDLGADNQNGRLHTPNLYSSPAGSQKFLAGKNTVYVSIFNFPIPLIFFSLANF